MHLMIGTTASAKGAVAIGKNAKATSEDAVAIGTNAQATLQGAVALGSGSTTATGLQVKDLLRLMVLPIILQVPQAIQIMQVSVGSAGATRQIKNVAAGEYLLQVQMLLMDPIICCSKGC